MKTEALRLLEDSELVYSSEEVGAAIEVLSRRISIEVGYRSPLLLCVMTGGVVLAGRMIPLLNFPLEVDYVQATRYAGGTVGGDVTWRVAPPERVAGRVVVLVDDILDEGHTLAAIRERCLALGALEVKVAVLTEKLLGHEKPIRADFVGLEVPDRYVFGCGMDAFGWWRNLPEIRALK